MSLSTEQLVERIHAAPGRVVLAVSGGGSRAVSALLEVPGASRTVLEAVVPYAAAAMAEWIGGWLDGFCSPRAARAMAMAAFHRAGRFHEGETSPAGISCTAGLATDRPRRGEHRAHVALQTEFVTATWSILLEKGSRSRAEEERLVCRLILNAVAEACGVEERLELDLLENERIEETRSTAPQSWQDLLLGRAKAVIARGARTSQAILAGAFNPLHVGHRRMAEIAGKTLGVPVAMELSIVNVDKPPLDYFEIERRLDQFDAEQPVWLTRASRFEEKSRLFPGATFIVGTDTLRRIADPRYYGDDPAARLAALERIVRRGCKFLVFGRDMGTGFFRLCDLDLPEVLRKNCREISADEFREDVSSTALRKAGAW